MAEINKIKINIGDILLELEGDEIFVKELFSDIRKNGFGQLSITKNVETKYEKTTEEKSEQTMENSKKESDETQSFNNDFELPALNDIVMKDVVSKESDWLVVYAMYQSEQGTKTFTMEEIRNKYRETNRFTVNRNKNFATNFKKVISDNLIAGLNELDFKMTSAGLESARKILFANGESKVKRKRTSGKNFTKQSFNVVDLKLTAEQRQNFKSIFNGFRKPSNMEKVLIISCWLKENHGVDEVDADTIFTMLRIADAPASFDLKASLKNAKATNNYYIDGSERGKYKLHHIGEDHYKELEMKE